MPEPRLTESQERLHDKNGRPIYPGDLLRSFHFIGARRKRHYLYHTAVTNEAGTLDMVPTCHLEPSKVKDGGRCLLSQNMASRCEIIHGYGPRGCLSFEDRRRTPAGDAWIAARDEEQEETQ